MSESCCEHCEEQYREQLERREAEITRLEAEVERLRAEVESQRRESEFHRKALVHERDERQSTIAMCQQLQIERDDLAARLASLSSDKAT